jgi:uncharacterized protein (TIGR00730 family)
VNGPAGARRVCVFCGSSDEVAPVYLETAHALGRALALRGMTLVYGGGGTGMMGRLADGALQAGGHVIGVLTEQFDTPALRHAVLSEKRVVPTMHQRKALMAELSEAFLALPGGFGTLEELFEVLCWAQLGLHRRPIGLLNSGGYYDPLLATIQRARDEGFIYQEHHELFFTAATPEALLDLIDEYRPPSGLERWLRLDVV